MTLEELAAYLRVHASTVYRMLKRQEIPAFRMGSDWRFVRKEIEEWSHARTIGGKVELETPRDQVVQGVISRSRRES
jgi:excisionase family DNA binding protein